MDCKFKTDLGLVTVSDDVLVRVAAWLPNGPQTVSFS